jgi:Uma2 family endonuclease
MKAISARAVSSGNARENRIPGEGAAMGMAAAKFWTIAELDALPDDGNKYEVIDGELLVTPEPTQEHQHILSRLTWLLYPFVNAHDLGMVFDSHSSVRVSGASVEPDLMVRQPAEDVKQPWEDAPIPILVVEVHSPGTRRRDQVHKRNFYMSRGVPEYWMVDPERGSITQVRPGRDDIIARDTITWRPVGSDAELTFEITQIFGPR